MESGAPHTAIPKAPPIEPGPIDVYPREPKPLGRFGRIWLWLEFITLYAFIPALVAAVMDPSERFDGLFDAVGLTVLSNPPWPPGSIILPLVFVFGLLLGLFLVVDPTFDNRQLWNWRAFKRDLPRMAPLFLANAAAMLGIAWALQKFTGIMTLTTSDGQQVGHFLRLPREAPLLLLAIAIGYPIASAFPQEVTHRAFFFHRYRRIIPNPRVLFTLNVLAFVWLHAPFWGLMAFVITLPGGILFAWTWVRTRSLLAVGVEHWLYGWWLFFTGLGWFVYAGSVGA